MKLWTALTGAICFALACNFDTVLLAAAYGGRGLSISPGPSLVLAGVTTLITALSLLLGNAATAVLPPETAEVLGGLALVGIGCWFLLDYLRGRTEAAEEEPSSPGLAGWVSLAAALAVNNAGAGVAAGAAGIPTLAAAGSNFLGTRVALPLGHRLGCGAAERLLGRYALPLSGGLLVLLGAWEVLL